MSSKTQAFPVSIPLSRVASYLLDTGCLGRLCSEKEKGERVRPDISDRRLALIYPLAGTVSHGHCG